MIQEIILLVLFTLALSQNESDYNEDSIYAMGKEKQEVVRLSHKLQNPLLVYRNICTFSHEDWESLKPIQVEYYVEKRSVVYATGSFNYTFIDNGPPEYRNAFYASACEEAYNNEKDMDSKIAGIVRGYYLRLKKCADLPDVEEACKYKGPEKSETGSASRDGTT